MLKTVSIAIAAFILAGGIACADSISGKFGITGKAGFLVPLEDRFLTGSAITGPAEGQSDFAGGGGVIYGIGDHFALELEALRVPNLDVEIGGNKAYEAALTDLSVGLQYRVAPQSRLVPLVGAGIDFIEGDLDATVAGADYRLDWTIGGHANVGLDFFLTPGVALVLDLRGIYAPRGDVMAGDVKVAKYDPLSFVGMLGVRLLLPKSAFR